MSDEDVSRIKVELSIHEDPFMKTWGEYVLCYVSNNWAYFTESLDGQWGDDWDDAPYQHNAGRPYGSYNSDDDHPDCFAVVLATDLEPPARTVNRAVSVQEINDQKHPWLSTLDFMEDDVELYSETYRDVVETVEERDGAVYVPRKPNL